MGSRGGGALGAGGPVGVVARPVVAVAERLSGLLEELDPAQVPVGDAVELVGVFARIEHLAAAGVALASARVASSSSWAVGGHRSPAHWVAEQTGVGVGDAMKVLETAEGAEVAVVKEALTTGRVSPRQARAVARAEKAAPGSAPGLLARSGELSVKELETESDRIAHSAANESDAQRAERLRKKRCLRTGTTPDGMGWGRWELPPAQHARVMARLGPLTDRVFTTARRAGSREPVEAYAADALVAALDHPAPAGDVGGCEPEGWSFAKVIVRVDAGALDRGQLDAGEVCEIAGQGPIAVSDAWRIIDGGALVAAVTTRGARIDQVVHLGRRPTALQRTALDWTTGGTCAIQGCTSTARHEIDHVADWAHTHVTRLRDLAGVCGHHHDLKTHHGHRFSTPAPDGTRRLLPPGTHDTGPPGEAPSTGSTGPPVDQIGLFDTG